MNCGVKGYDTVNELTELEENYLNYKPDMVIVAINSSDIVDILVRGGKERIGRPFYKPPGSPRWEIFFGSSYIVRLFVQGILGYDWTLKSERQRNADTQRGLDIIYQTVLDFKKLSKDHGFRLVTVFHPTVQELINDSWQFDGIIEKLSEDNDIAVINLLVYYKAMCEKLRIRASDIYWPVDLHHNPMGYRLFASGVADAIAKLPDSAN